MHVIVTGYKNPNAKMRNGDYFVDIRIVAIPDQTDDPKVESGNTDSLISSLNRLITERCGDVLDEYNININNVIQEPRTDKRPSALRISLAESLAQDFLKDEFWANPIGRLLSKKCYKDEAGNKFYVTIPFSFNINDVLQQINSSQATREDYDNAMNITSDFIHKLFQKLDSDEVQQFLQNFCGNIKFVASNGQGNGWEYVQLSDRNSIMVAAQYALKGIKPKFVCNARDWEIYFNRKLIPNAVGAVIEVPVRNKRRDDNRYSSATNGRNLSSDLHQNGSIGYLANWVGFNQNDLEKNMYFGWVYDETQTELMTDENGNPLPDLFYDGSQQRRVTNVGNDATLAFGTQDIENIDNDNVKKGLASPFDDNTSKIPQCIENIANSIQLKRFKNKNGRNKYESVIPLIDRALSTKPTVNHMIGIIQEIAKCDLYQNENINQKVDGMARIVTSVIMAKCGFGSVGQMASYARQIIQNKAEALQLSDVITNIAVLINGSLIQKNTMNENKLNEMLCQPTSFEELIHDLNLEDVVGTNNVQPNAVSLQEIKKSFFETLNNLKKK